jgi:uncharacterized OB-fold protein
MSDDLSAPYWAGAEQGRLVVQQCDGCGSLRHYPRLLCPVCYSFDWTPYPASHKGSVFSWTVTHQVFDASVTSEVPYVLVTVTMEDGVRVLGRIAPDVQLRPDLAVELTFETDAHDRPQPVFVLPASVR